MIPFASQRALGQDLATHLQNSHDNETVEVHQVRGAVARDLHGAFAEWEAQADALTRCEKYLYSLSINPDPAQGKLTRGQYMDYITRVEERTGLTGQPRAIVFHTKYGREHCHVVWSRIDADRGKAIHLAFDHEKLMKVTREFARDHGLKLPDGYHKDTREKTPKKNKQLSLHEKDQERKTGLTREDHIAQVTAAWRSSDSPKAFVQALADRGYVLATGDRPYVLVDTYGGMHALARMIDDKAVRTKTLRAFLAKDFPPGSLPTVDEAKLLINAHRKAVEERRKEKDQKTEVASIRKQHAEALKLLRQSQAIRRAEVQRVVDQLKADQTDARERLAANQRVLRDRLRVAHLAATRRIRKERYQNRPTGLARFLGKVTGVNLLIKKIHERQDRKRLALYIEQRRALRQSQLSDRTLLQRRHELQALDMNRRLRAHKEIERREMKSLRVRLQKDLHVHDRTKRLRTPVVNHTLTPTGRRENIVRAMGKFTAPMFVDAFEKAGTYGEQKVTAKLAMEFARVARAPDKGAERDHATGDKGARMLEADEKFLHQKAGEFNRAATETSPEPVQPKRDFTRAANPEREAARGDSAGGPKAETSSQTNSETTPKRERLSPRRPRSRERDKDRGDDFGR